MACWVGDETMLRCSATAQAPVPEITQGVANGEQFEADGGNEKTGGRADRWLRCARHGTTNACKLTSYSSSYLAICPFDAQMYPWSVETASVGGMFRIRSRSALQPFASTFATSRSVALISLPSAKYTSKRRLARSRLALGPALISSCTMCSSLVLKSRLAR